MNSRLPAITEPLPIPSNKKHSGASAFLGTFGANVLIQACGVLQGVLIARLLGPVGRGEYAAVILWPGVFATLGIFGSNIALSRAATRCEDLGSIIRTAIVLALITACISGLVCYFALPFLLPQAERHLLTISQLFVIFIPLNHLALNLNSIEQGIGDFIRFNITRLILNPLYVLMVVALWVLGIREVAWYAIALLLANLAVVLVRMGLALRAHSLFGPLYSLANVVKGSMHFGLAGIAQPLYQQADKALLLWLLGSRDLGLYMVALSASGVIGSVTNASGVVSFTMAAQAGSGEGFERIAKAFRMSLLLWIILGGLLAFVMPWVLPLIYGRGFSDAISPARLLIIGSAFGGLANLLEQAMRGQGRAFVGLEGRAFGLVAMALGGIYLSSPLGISGICVAYIAGQSICLGVILRRVNQHYGIRGIAGYIPRVNEFRELSVRIGNQLLARIRTRPADGRSA